MTSATCIYGTPAPVDVLALAAHPDDVELSAGGTVCKLTRQGHRVAIVDFTRGELGTRGTPEGRIEESIRAARVIGLTARENLGMPDGDIANTKENQHAIVRGGRRPNARKCGEQQESQAAQADGQDGTPGTPLTKGTAAD